MKDDAERAREAIAAGLRSWVADTHDIALSRTMICDAVDHIIAQPGLLAFAQQPEGWRSIEQLPDEMKDGSKFMVCDGQGGYDFASWHRDHVCGVNDGWAPFTHWHPLPAPPAAMLDAAPPGEE